MDRARYHKTRIGNHALQRESLMIGYEYDPTLSEGSVKPPVFLTSTFVFRTAEQRRDFLFEIKGEQAEAFAFLNQLQLFKLAVSPGGTESLVCRPTTTVHSGLTEEARREIGITPSLAPMSVSIESSR